MKTLFVLTVVFATAAANANQPKTAVNLPMDAWYSIFQNQKKIGYFFSRYEWAGKEQNQIKYSSTLIRIMDGKFFEEQLMELAGADMKPISLKYRKVGDKEEDFTNIDIADGKATIDNKSSLKGQKKTMDFPADTIFGSFVNFMFLTIKGKMESNKDYNVKVVDEGDFSVKPCRIKLSKGNSYTLTCQDQVGEYTIDNKGLITYQAANNKELEVKKTSMVDATKGFPKPGERKP